MNSADLIATVKKQPVGVVCGVLCLVFAAVLYVRSDKIEESQTEYDAKSAEAARILTNVSNSKNLPEQAAEMQALSKELDARLIHAGQLAVNLQFFYKLEAETEVKLANVNQGTPAKTKTQFLAIPFTLAVQGTYKQLFTLLHRLEDRSHFCHFSNVSFTKSGGGGGDTSGTAADAMTMNLNIELLGLP
jgi:Tfp pilus assembly protein PilO